MEKQQQQYYINNKQDRDRPALWFYERVAKKNFRTGHILDFGCGLGFYVKRLAKHFKVDGIEISDYARNYCQELVENSVFYSSTSSIKSGKYKGITSIHVIEHINDIELKKIFLEWRRILTSDGRVLCVTPDKHGRAHKVKGDSWAGFGDRTHINLKSYKEWEKIFAENGFTILKISADGMWKFPYSKKYPKYIDVLIYGTFTIIQFIVGRLILPPGSGESSIFLLEKTNPE